MSSFTESGDDTISFTGATPQDFDSFAADSDSVTDSPIYNNSSYTAGEDVFLSHQASEIPSSPQIYGSDGGFLPEENGKGLRGGYGGVDGPILPDMGEMQHEEGFALREWRRQNAIRLEEKEKQEKEVLSQIIDEADEYKVEFYRKRIIACESNKSTNREKEKIFVASLEKFHAEADKNYWKSIAELIPNEVVAIEKKRVKKDQEKKPSVVVVHGPKPGKPTDLSRMRQILLKLKHTTPDHLKFIPPPQPAAAASENDVAKTASSSSNVPPPAPVVAQPEVVAAA